MPGNIVVNNGATLYNIAEIKKMGTSAGYVNSASINPSPNQFYQLGEVERAYVTLNNADTLSYNEYMFEVTYSGEAPKLVINSTEDLYWLKEVTVKSGYRYQFSILNRVVLWTEAAVV